MNCGISLATFVLVFAGLSSTCLAQPVAKAPPESLPVRLSWFPRFSPDGTKLATAHGDWDQKNAGEARIWEAATGKELFVLPTERGVRSVAWSPSGKILAAGTYGLALYFFNTQTGEEIAKMPLEGHVEVVLFSPDERRFITSFNGGSIIVWELESGRAVHNFHLAHKGGVWGLAQSRDGKRLASAGQDAHVRIYDLERFEILHAIKHPEGTNGLAFTADGTRLLTGCEDGKIRVYDVAAGKLERQLSGHDGGSITDLQFSSDGKLLASAGIDRTIRLWDTTDIERPMLKHTFPAHESFAFGVAISPDDKLLASAGWDDQIHVWTIENLKEQWTWKR